MKINQYVSIGADTYNEAINAEDKGRDCFNAGGMARINEAINNIESLPSAHLVISDLVKGLITDSKQVEVHYLQDEWYYVKLNSRYYKCDQFDSLLRCLKNEYN